MGNGFYITNKCSMLVHFNYQGPKILTNNLISSINISKNFKLIIEVHYPFKIKVIYIHSSQVKLNLYMVNVINKFHVDSPIYAKCMLSFLLQKSKMKFNKSYQNKVLILIYRSYTINFWSNYKLNIFGHNNFRTWFIITELSMNKCKLINKQFVKVN